MKLLKRLSVLALTAALTLSMAVPAMAAGSIEVTTTGPASRART